MRILVRRINETGCPARRNHNIAPKGEPVLAEAGDSPYRTRLIDGEQGVCVRFGGVGAPWVLAYEVAAPETRAVAAARERNAARFSKVENIA